MPNPQSIPVHWVEESASSTIAEVAVRLRVVTLIVVVVIVAVKVVVVTRAVIGGVEIVSVAAGAMTNV